MPDGSTVDVPLARERTTIGRRADNDVCLSDLAVSGEHAVVVTILADSFLEDLGSTNGTLVNGKAIGKHFLRDRDRIDIGHHRLVYCVDEGVTMSSEVVGMARINARDFGERVDTAKPFERERVARVLPRPDSTDAATASAAAVIPVTGAAALPASAAADPAPARVPQTDPLSMPSLPAPPAMQASIKVLSGLNAGVSIPLSKTETTIGRPGVQVMSIVNLGTSFRLKPIEGAAPPAVNGRLVEQDGIELATGDVVDIAGTQLEFVFVTPVAGENDSVR